MDIKNMTIEELEHSISEFDYIYQDGAIFNKKDVEVLAGLSEHLAGIVKDLKVNSFGQVRD